MSDENGRDAAGGSEAGGQADPRERAEAAALLGEVRAVRRAARRARHAYWFPLVLFGLLTAASVPLYVQRIPTRSGVWYTRVVGPAFVHATYLGSFGLLTSVWTPYYWLAALLIGAGATAGWYRWRGNRVGLRTPARGYAITALVLVVLAILVPVIARSVGRGALFTVMPGDLVIRGTFPFVLIAAGLCFLAWAERSIALAMIAAVYLALSLVASLYDIVNVFYRLGWDVSASASQLPNVVLPALVLLFSGAGAWVVQRRRRAPAGAAATGAS